MTPVINRACLLLECEETFDRRFHGAERRPTFSDGFGGDTDSNAMINFERIVRPFVI